MRAWPARWARSPRRTPIGLCLRGAELRALQLERVRDGLRLRRDVRAVLSAESEELWSQPALLRRVLHSGFRGRRVATVLPAAHVKLMVVDFRATDPAQEARALGALVSERVAESLDELVVDSIPLRAPTAKEGHPTQRSAVVAVARRDDVIAYLEWIRRAGFEVDSLEIAPSAIRRLIAWQPQALGDAIRLVLHCDGDESALLALWGRRLLVYRDLECSEQRICERAAKALDVETEVARGMLAEQRAVAGSAEGEGRGALREAMVEILRPEFAALGEGVRQALLYAASRTHGASVERVYLTGVFRPWPAVHELLAELLPVAPEPLAPWSGIDAPAASPAADAGGVETGIDVALGLALRGMTSDA